MSQLEYRSMGLNKASLVINQKKKKSKSKHPTLGTNTEGADKLHKFTCDKKIHP